MISHLNNPQYKYIKLYGHPGSKTEYIEKILKNDFSNLQKNNESNKIGNNVNIESDILYLYLQRKFIDTILSLFEIRIKYGISDKISFKDFHNSQYCNICKSNCECNMFMNIEMSPRTYWETHLNSWINLSIKYDNVLIVFFNKISKQYERKENERI